MALHSSAAPEPTGSESAPARAADQERPLAGGSASGALLVAAAAILWGTTGTSQALAPPGASSLAVGAARIAIGGLALLAYAAWRSGPKALRALFGRWPLALAGIAGVTGYQLLFFSAVRTTGVALGTLVTLGSSPILVGLLGYALRERLTAAWGGATAIIVTGLALLLLPATAQVRWDGVLTALGAAASYAVYTVVSRALLMRGLSGDVIIGVLFGGAVVPLGIAASGADFGWLAHPSGLAVAAWLGLAATAFPYWLWIKGLSRVPVSVAGTMALAEPVTATLLGVLLLGESLTVVAAAGVCLVVLGLLAMGRVSG
ncbi:DMT family transporter [Carbonactinospora thermoautotrophica]|uniref:DMT family transporter n=1 Tax=Carbonactinospora thermoautotrophica TaxID=1469144 RepID=UPI002270B1A3|nr:EamA family transporter [Carbonactinospora thermoautotrophica]